MSTKTSCSYEVPTDLCYLSISGSHLSCWSLSSFCHETEICYIMFCQIRRLSPTWTLAGAWTYHLPGSVQSALQPPAQHIMPHILLSPGRSFSSILPVCLVWMLWLDLDVGSTGSSIQHTCASGSPSLHPPTHRKTEGRWEWLVSRTWPQVLLTFN